MELLFPAGSKKHIEVAIKNKVGAVYGGLKNWNARDKADNFTVREYSRIITRLHEHKIKFYLTLNTLMLDNDISDVVKIISNKNFILPDAFIVADVGLIIKLAEICPEVPIHLSTQFGIHCQEDIDIAKELGAKRVILSRELTKDKIEELSRNSNIETECFVYGSQCISFSGQCYLSSLLNGGSGNRGKCEIFCRDNYSVDNKLGNLLYMPDLSCSEMIAKLPNVSCWKMEGRKRNPEMLGKFVENMRICQQTGYIYGTDLSQNRLFNEKHNRSLSLIDSAPYRLNGNNISFDIKSENGFIREITFIDSQGKGYKLSSKSPCEFIKFDMDDIIRQIESKTHKNIYKVNCNENIVSYFIDRNILDKLMQFADKSHLSNRYPLDNRTNIIIETDDITIAESLTNQFQIIYNIADIKRFKQLIKSTADIIYKLPLFNFDNENLSDLYKSIDGKPVMFTRLGQIKFARDSGAVFKKMLTEYTIQIWNRGSLKYLKDIGITHFSASPELSLRQNEIILKGEHRNYILYGYPPLAYTRMCFKHLFDCTQCCSELKKIHNSDKGIDFNIKCYDDHRAILSDKPIYNGYPATDNKTSFRIIANGMNEKEILDAVNNQKLLIANSYLGNTHIERV